MTQDHASVSFTCPKCDTKLTWPDDATDDTAIACAKCGEPFGTYADLRHKAMEATSREVRAIIKRTFDIG
jgi:DNA-directed RNA polymerase subunit RPC12/RpoP